MAKQKPAASRAGSALFIGKAAEAKSNGHPDQTSSAESPEKIERHPEFFFDNTLIAIQVEKTLFNVHKYLLVKSEVFSEMFSGFKIEDDEPQPGSSPEHPIVIHGAAASDFAALLKILYANHFSSNKPTPEGSLIIPAFRLANLLNFSELRTFLLPHAENNLGDVDKIVFAREFDIKDWLAPAHIRLCQRSSPLSTEEARKLGVDSVLLVWRMREQHRDKPSGSTSNFIASQTYCYACTGLTYIGSGNTCKACNGSYGYLRCDGAGKMVQTISTTTDNTAIEAGVKKWVEDGCIMKG
ncbi:hypothetical protein ACGC1H_005946 [Rhizoctonia solani]|uniref:BTB domain-containing protein n=1 Tax=Rhizoctonia solani TaxID=456999 RepID=A0A8H3GWU7_9AGAM|nr:unnamed protein product [Rhizoctonia solani]